MGTIVVPFTQKEWSAVRDVLSDSTFDEKLTTHAAAIVNMWCVRQGNNVPMIFHITKLVLDCEIADYKTDFTNSVSVHSLQSCYGICIIRCVNYVSEVCQQLNGLQSIANAVSNMGIPEWIVGIRHRATHNTMPPLQLLRKGFQFFRQWLYTKYWSKELEEAITFVEPKLVQEQRLALDRSNEREKACHKDLNEFVKWRNMDPCSIINDPLRNSRLSALTTKLETIPDVFTSFLVKRVFTLSMKQLKESDLSFNVVDEIWKIPVPFQLYWSPVITMYMQKQLISKLISVFVDYMFDKNTSLMIRQQCSGWVHLICDMIFRLLPYTISSTELDNWRNIVKLMLNNSASFNNDTIVLVLTKTSVISDKKKQQVLRLIELRKMNAKSVKNDGDGIASRNLSVLDRNLKFCTNIKTADSVSTSSDELTVAFRVSKINFEEVPLGLLPSQTADMLDLTID